MVVTKCDRCGKVFEPKCYTYDNVTVHQNELRRGGVFGEYKQDLCDECLNAFFDFMAGKAVKEVGNVSH